MHDRYSVPADDLIFTRDPSAILPELVSSVHSPFLACCGHPEQNDWLSPFIHRLSSANHHVKEIERPNQAHD
jgi:hypothetical protein